MNTNKSLFRKLVKKLSALTLALLLIIANTIYSQTNDTISSRKSNIEVMTENGPFSSSWEKQPEYPGAPNRFFQPVRY